MGLFVIMHIPKPAGISLPIGQIDKVFHFGGYALLASLCALYARRSSPVLTRGWYVKWILILALYAAADEGLQPFVNRTADVFDWVADVAGVLVAFAFLRPKRPTE